MKILDVEVVKDKFGEMGNCYVVSVCNDKDNSVAKKYVVLKPHFDRKNTINAKTGTLEGWIKAFEWGRSPHYDGRYEYIRALSSFVFIYHNGELVEISDFRFNRSKIHDDNKFKIFQRLNR